MYSLPTGSSKERIEASAQFLSPSFLTQRYQSQLDRHMLQPYYDLSVVLTCQKSAREGSSACHPKMLTFEDIAFYDSLRISVFQSIILFFVGYSPHGNIHTNYNVENSTNLTPVQAICRVVVPIVAVQEQFAPYRQSIVTANLTGCLYNTLNSEIDLEAGWLTHAEVIVWALMFGVHTSRGIANEKEAWFLRALVKGIRKRNGQRGQLGGDWKWEWNAVKAVLERFHWCERLFGEAFKVSQFRISPCVEDILHHERTCRFEIKG